jgi:nucleotide-binding universal stress UspA family protein
MIALKHILVPHDFSETSAASVNFAAALARSFGADLVFLYVGDHAQTEVEGEAAAHADGSVDATIRARLMATLSPIDQATLAVQYYVRTGSPATEIVRFASDHDIDLIVMGTHGRGFVGHMVMGSVAEKVVRSAPCPVLTVRNPTQAAQGMDVVEEAIDAARAAI